MQRSHCCSLSQRTAWPMLVLKGWQIKMKCHGCSLSCNGLLFFGFCISLTLPHCSWFFFELHNCIICPRFRVLCWKICNHSYFGNVILACILISSAMLAAEDPLNATSKRNQVLNYFDYIFTSVFTIEILIKV